MAYPAIQYSTGAKLPAGGVKPVSSPYASFPQLGASGALQLANAPAPSASSALQLANTPASPPPPDAIDRYISSHPPQTPAQTPKTPQSPSTPNTPQGPAAGGNAFDLSTDPLVQRIRALNESTYNGAVAAADAASKQALISSGFGDVARAARFGSLEHPTTGDEATALAAEGNPFSTAANLRLGHENSQHAIDQGDNLANLFYSSTRANHLGDEAHNYLGQTSAAEDALRATLSDILQKLVGVKNSGQLDETNALETARQNAISNAIASGSKFAGYDANGNPIFTGGAGDTDTSGDTTPAPGAPATGPNLGAILTGLVNPPVAAPAAPAAAPAPAGTPATGPSLGAILTGLVNAPASPIAAALKAKGNSRAKLA